MIRMKLSIIIPAFNAENTMERCIKSIITSQMNDLQVIIVDDHSTDNTYNLCERLQKKFSVIELYKTRGKGVSAARNTGLANADGDVIGFCDADDYYESEILGEVIHEFESDEKLDMCCWGFYIKEYDGKIIKTCSVSDKHISARRMFERVLCDSRIMGSVWNKFYRDSFIAGVTFNEKLSYCEDTAFNAEILLQNKKAKCLLKKKPIYNYVQNLNSVTHNNQELFNNRDELKYIESMHYISGMVSDHFEKNCVKREVYILAQQAYSSDLTFLQKINLIYEIRRCFVIFAFSCMKFAPLENLKAIIKGSIIILKM